jgi:hypothetical protein
VGVDGAAHLTPLRDVEGASVTAEIHRTPRLDQSPRLAVAPRPAGARTAHGAQTAEDSAELN